MGVTIYPSARSNCSTTPVRHAYTAQRLPLPLRAPLFRAERQNLPCCSSSRRLITVTSSYLTRTQSPLPPHPKYVPVPPVPYFPTMWVAFPSRPTHPNSSQHRDSEHARKPKVRSRPCLALCSQGSAISLDSTPRCIRHVPIYSDDGYTSDAPSTTRRHVRRHAERGIRMGSPVPLILRYPHSRCWQCPHSQCFDT